MTIGDDLTTTLGNEVMDFAEFLRGRYGDNLKLGTIGIVVEIEGTDTDGGESHVIEYSCTDTRRWVQKGFFEAAVDSVVASSGTTTIE